MLRNAVIALAVGGLTASAARAEEAEKLAKQLVNPISTLISVPFQGNANWNIGPENAGDQVYFNLQPVVPVALSEDWNLILRTILPVFLSQDEVYPGAGERTGLGNTVQSVFLSPERVVDGFTWGVGPVFLLPTSTDSLMGPDKWGVGPTGVVLWQGGGWTVGLLANHIWSVAGPDHEADVNTSYMQPILAYTTRDAWTFSVNSEALYDWENEAWTVPLNAQVSKVVTVNEQPVSVFGGIRYWAESPEDVGPDGWGARFGVTFLFPK